MVFAIPLSCIAGAGLVVAQEPMARSVMGDFFYFVLIVDVFSGV